MMMFFPPISRWHFLKSGAHSLLTMRPTSVDPVKLTSLTSLWMINGDPASGPSPNTTFITPRGKPASFKACIKLKVESGVSSAGLMTTVFPVTSAGIAFHDGIAIGKFHGQMRPATPTGVGSLNENL